MREGVVLVFDLGGTSLRAALIDADGLTAALHRAPLASGLEADPESWWRALIDAADALAEAAPDSFARCRAIAISAFTRSQVFLDAEGGSLRPAILWADARAAQTLDELLEALPTDHPETKEVNAFHPLARLWWVARREAQIAGSLSVVLEPKDFLNFRLTGRIAGDTVSMSRLAASAAASRAGPSLFDAAGLKRSWLPPLLEPTSTLGAALPDLPGALRHVAGAPVMTMGNDTWASVVGLGAMRRGVAYNISGTTEVFGLLDDRPASAEGLLTVRWGDQLVQIGGPSQTGADALAWLLSVIGSPEQPALDVVLETLMARPRASDPLLFLPYLQGERVPYWDPALRGAFIGLSRRHEAVDLAWAVMEGVAFLNRIVLERAEAATGRSVTEIRFGGGGAASAIWRQIKADVMDRPVVAPAIAEQGLSGAAIVAWTGLGCFDSLDAAQEALAPPGRRYLPTPGRRAGYDRLFRLFRESETALAPVSRSLADWTWEGAPQ